MIIRPRSRASKIPDQIYVVQCSSGDEPLVNDREAKLLTLALDPAERGGEIDVSGVKLVTSWRKRGVTPQELLEPLSRAPTRPDRALEAARARRMPFGRHRGKVLAEVPRDYLRWVVAECGNLSLTLREAIVLILESC